LFTKGRWPQARQIINLPLGSSDFWRVTNSNYKTTKKLPAVDLSALPFGGQQALASRRTSLGASRSRKSDYVFIA
jgi:hypothetical protein